MRRPLAILAVVAALAVVGCAAPPDDPGELGVENGFRYDADIAVTTGDGLNASEQEAVVGRAMARIEILRGQEFLETTEVTVISREEFRNRSGDPPGPTNLSDRQLWNEQVWEALHLVGENETYPETRSTNRGTAVVGYYSPSKGKIVLVSDSETPQVSRGTLVHELVHALQDQQLNLGESRDFQDEQLAVRSVVEGDANYVQALYDQRCAGSWDCIETSRGSGARSDSFNQGVFLVSFLPYAEGPQFVDAIRNEGDFGDVDDLYENYPESTEEVIHPERYPEDEPLEVRVPDRARGDWERFTDIDRPTNDTIGEGSIYAMFVATGVIDRTGPGQYNYDHPISTGWEGDTLIPYRNGDGGYGYVWRLHWETVDDAQEFLDTYRDLLDSRDADRVGTGQFVIEDGSFADAFRVSRDGETVTIVNAPTPAELDAIHSPP
ncbi:MAG: Hvo_1808 family surface protein [Halapricum sp.]